jgi:hypothetical protein
LFWAKTQIFRQFRLQKNPNIGLGLGSSDLSC